MKMDDKHLQDIKKVIGLDFTQDLLIFILTKLEALDSAPDTKPVLECYTLLLSWTYEYLCKPASVLDAEQLSKQSDIVHGLHQMIDADNEYIGDAEHYQLVRQCMYKYASELSINDLKGKIQMKEFICSWLERSLRLHILKTPSEYISQATHSPYIVPSMGKLSIDCKMPRIGALEARTFSQHGFNLFLNSFTSSSNVQYPDLVSFLSRLLDTRMNILHLSCEQAEHLLAILDKTNSAHHCDFVEKLLYHVANAYQRRRFLTRNLYFPEVSTLGSAFEISSYITMLG
jgi:hypothetical protein